MADKRISQLVDRGTVANNDVVPIVVSGAVTTNKATISSIQTFMQGNLDLGVTSVGFTLTQTDGQHISVTGSPITTSGNITLNLPRATDSIRGLLDSEDFINFSNKQPAGNYVTTDTVQTITAQKSFAGGGSSDSVIISHGSGSGFALDAIKSGNGEVIRVLKTGGSGNAMTITGGNLGAEAATFSGVVTTTPDAVINAVNFGRGGGDFTSNTRAGAGALQSNTTGQQNTSFGTQSLLLNTTGSFNTGLGYNALLRTTTGGSNTAVGAQALIENTTGSQNTATGSFSLQNTTTGGGNTAIGSASMQLNTTGGSNTAVGLVALTKNTAGNANTGIGAYALENNVAGNQNTAVGQEALENNTTGGNNTAIGFQSLRNNTGNGANTAVGNLSSWNNVGSFNTSLGHTSLFWNTTGTYNVGLGVASMYNNTTGSYNIAIGDQSGQFISAGGDNVISNNSLFIGTQTRALANNQTNQIVIGHNAIGNGSNTVTIGNSSITNTYLRGTVRLTDTGTASSINIISDSIGNGAINIEKNTNGTGIRVVNDGIGVGIFSLNTSTGSAVTIGNSSTGKGLVIDNAGGATGDPFVYTLGGASFVKAKIDYLGNLTAVGGTLTGALNGTSAVFSGDVGVNTSNYTVTSGFTGVGINNNTNGGLLDLLLNNVKKGELYITSTSFNMYGFAGVGLNLTVDNNSSKGLFLASTGAATFSSTVQTTGIKFPATQVSSADSNTLDDYEEGTWTPAYSGAGTPSYSVQFGKYTKIGNIVYCTISIKATSVSGASGITITGLPFTSADQSDNQQRSTYSPRLGGHISGISENTAKFRTNGNSLTGVKGDLLTTIMTAMEFSVGGSPEVNGSFWYYV